MARTAVSSDYYSLLGVSPAAEDVVIRAAYRALMRHYHPDTNPDPEAQRRAQEIGAAYAVLRDPDKRAEYDAERAGHDLAFTEPPPEARRPPAMRGLGIASAALAVALVVTVSVWPLPEPPKGSSSTPATAPAAASKSRPPVELEPENERLARLHRDSAVAPAVEPMIPLEEAQIIEPVVLPPDPIPRLAPRRIASAPPRRPIVPTVTPAAPARSATQTQKAEEASAGCRPGGSVIVSTGCKNDRLAALDRMAAGFFSQSMAHADAAKKELLMGSHTRSAARRSACHSDSCLSDAYLRQMREISAIMEVRPASSQ